MENIFYITINGVYASILVSSFMFRVLEWGISYSRSTFRVSEAWNGKLKSTQSTKTRQIK